MNYRLHLLLSTSPPIHHGCLPPSKIKTIKDILGYHNKASDDEGSYNDDDNVINNIINALNTLFAS
jgi:hypothetical protein